MSGLNTRSALTFIFITLLIDITGWGIIIPVMPGLIQQLSGGDLSDASRIGGWISFAYAVMQFFFAPILGNLSDRFGRRPIILISLLGFAADYVLLALAPSLSWLFIARIIAGVTGASITTASAYIADVSNNENRAKNFGLIGAAFGLGFIIGPVVGGVLGQFGPRVPFWAAAVLCLINFIYGYFVLPESLGQSHRRPFDWKRANPIGSFKIFFRHPMISGLVIALFMAYIAGHAVQSNWNFFTMYRFSWDQKMVGISLGVVGFLVALVQGVLIRWTSQIWSNKISVLVGLLLYSLGMFLFAFATQGWMMFVFLIPYALGGICGPALQAVISGQIPPSEQGELQGALTSVMSLTTIIGPPLMTNLFYFSTKNKDAFHFPGAPFLLASILYLLSAMVAYTVFNKRGNVIPYQSQNGI